MIRKVPKEIKQIIEQINFSRNNIIYYDTERGWVYEERDDILTNSQSKSIEENTPIKLENEAHPLEKLGPFGTEPTGITLTLRPDTDIYETTIDENLQRLKSIEGYGQHAPLSPVTLTGRAPDVAHIPEEATHFCWIYPLFGFTQLSKKEKAKIDQEIANKNPEYTFLALGGFAYFRFHQDTYQMLQANCLVQADNGLTFHGPFPWRSDYTDHLVKQGRFQEATISSLLTVGIKYYCFINPNEKLKSSKRNKRDWIPAPNGGFVYLYDSNYKTHVYDRYFCVANKPLREQAVAHVMPFSLIQKQSQLQNSSIQLNNFNTMSSLNTTINNNFLCLICQDRTIQCIFIPCKHMCACTECAQEIRQKLNSNCPLCRQNFREIWDVFL